MDWIPVLVGGLGLGALLNSFVSHLMTRRANDRDRWYQEQREAYIGLLGSLHDAAVKPSDANAKAFALWQTRCDLFGSAEVTRFAQQLVDTNDGPRGFRDSAFRNLIEAMRLDLKK
jgi:hypothetical protein